MRPIAKILPEQINVSEFDEVLDVRSPAEFAEDHLPGAVNLPVLDDEERARVGTIYKQRSPFEARRLGAALVSANIARHLSAHLADKPPGYRPLIYCWRGGERSMSLATVLASVGWQSALLDGGYKAYRRYVVDALGEILDKRPRLCVIGGLTGSGKTWLLDRLAAAGAQVLDLEGIAEHRGSALGESLSHPQPSQKAFENLLLQCLTGLDPARPIYLESESSRIGSVQIPAKLWALMRESRFVEILVPLAARAAYLLGDYQHFVQDRALLAEKLEKVRPLQPKERFATWQQQVADGDWSGFVESILEHHYDPAYLRSREKIYRPASMTLHAGAVSEGELDRLAREIVATAEE